MKEKSKRNYTVYFQIGEKKMKAKVLAESEQEAMDKLVIIHKVEVDKKDEFNQCMGMFDEILDIITPPHDPTR